VSAAHVVVVGAGVAGTAAAWILSERGARVSVIHDRAGSSALYSGAIDDEPAPSEHDRAASELEPDARAFVAALGLWRLGPLRLATREGVVRQASGADRALLDLEPLAGRNVAVADVSRDDWDAPLLVGAFGASDWARRTSTRFSLVDVPAIRRGHERRVTSHDFAALFDEPERLDALAKLLEECGKDHDAWLLGPWLGTVPSTALRMQSALSKPIGEATSSVGGAAGARFEHARTALFRARSIDIVSGRVTDIRERGERWVVEFDPADGARDHAGTRKRNGNELETTAAVIATGGVAAGGIAFVWEPERGAHGFRLPYTAPVALSLDGEAGDSGGSLYGASLESRGLGVLERVGVHADAEGAALRGSVAVSGLYAAGDALAARPRTVLEAVRSGIRAGRSALLRGRA